MTVMNLGQTDALTDTEMSARCTDAPKSHDMGNRWCMGEHTDIWGM